MVDRVEMVVFDLGGVLLQMQGVPAMRRLSGVSSDEELWNRWLTCSWVRRFESGACSADSFAEGVVNDWRLPVSPAAFLEQFRSWPTGPLPGAESLVREAMARVPVACFSNTNALHWNDHLREWPLVRLFETHFLSFEIGSLKPDRRAFDHLAGAVGPSPDRVLFLDDNTANVDGALASGFSAVRVSGVDEARQALVTAGVLDGSGAHLVPDLPG
ncbi:MAG TPA: HAD family phosphatase [Acidimicrobiales bacterium]|jgi:putative hydrolase of the HAD superfamily|nr:HAD family phosphatase [Acidimicrobiales bacterium]